MNGEESPVEFNADEEVKDNESSKDSRYILWVPVIAWDEEDSTVMPASAPLGGVKMKSSWLAKFLSATGVKQDRPAMPDFEVLLPGKKTEGAG